MNVNGDFGALSTCSVLLSALGAALLTCLDQMKITLKIPG